MPTKIAALLLLSLTSAALAASVSAQAPVPPSEEDVAAARIHFDLASEHYDRGRFLEAAREFALSYELSHRPALYYNIYVAYRDANVRDRAAAALRRYLDEETGEIANRAVLTARLESLEAELERERANARASERERDQVAEDRGSPLAAITFLSLAGATLVGGAVTLAIVLVDQGTLANDCPSKMDCDPALESTAERVQTLAVVTDVLFVTSAVAATVGVVLLVAGGGDDAASPSARLSCGPFGCSLGGRF